jgi:hypothetical protein
MELKQEVFIAQMEQVESKDDSQMISATVCVKGDLPETNKQVNKQMRD